MVIDNGSCLDISSANSGQGSALVNELPACCPGSPPPPQYVDGFTWTCVNSRNVKPWRDFVLIANTFGDHYKEVCAWGGGLRFTYRMTRISVLTVMTSDVKGLSMHRSPYTSV